MQGLLHSQDERPQVQVVRPVLGLNAGKKPLAQLQTEFLEAVTASEDGAL